MADFFSNVNVKEFQLDVRNNLGVLLILNTQTKVLQITLSVKEGYFTSAACFHTNKSI